MSESTPEELNSESEELSAAQAAPSTDDAPEAAATEAADAAEGVEPAEAADASAEADTETGEDSEAALDPAVEAAEEFKSDLRMQDGDWYVIHSYAGYENRVKTNIESRSVSLNMEEYLFEVQVPMEDVVEIKNGQRKKVRRVRIPGYVLVRMELTDESWGLVRHTPGVTGFVGNAYDPVPLTIDEVFQMLQPVFEEKQAEAAEQAGTPAPSGEQADYIVEWEVGESVLVKEGSFEGHPATIQEIRPENQKLTVLLSIFERDVPVELSFDQVGKL